MSVQPFFWHTLEKFWQQDELAGQILLCMLTYFIHREMRFPFQTRCDCLILPWKLNISPNSCTFQPQIIDMFAQICFLWVPTMLLPGGSTASCSWIKTPRWIQMLYPPLVRVHLQVAFLCWRSCKSSDSMSWAQGGNACCEGDHCLMRETLLGRSSYRGQNRARIVGERSNNGGPDSRNGRDDSELTTSL